MYLVLVVLALIGVALAAFAAIAALARSINERRSSREHAPASFHGKR